ncbi:hypothetical protein GJAV_G00139420 [Gymnothorax javanicus]|nr:hypothetical protein GJAV_G00139420 [Gymnothorax javanicus]
MGVSYSVCSCYKEEAIPYLGLLFNWTQSQRLAVCRSRSCELCSAQTRMETPGRTISEVKSLVQAAHGIESLEGISLFYDSWAETFEQDSSMLEYKAPFLVAERLSKSFEGDRQKALVLDVGCGTGRASAWLKKMGFQHFVGVDGSEKMLDLAKKKGIFQELRRCILGVTALPFQDGTFDAVVTAGCLSHGHLEVTAMRELCQVTKPGGYVSFSSRGDTSHKDYRNSLEHLLNQMESEGLWKRISVLEVEKWELGVTEQETGYIPGAVFLYRKSEK